ncbi:MAG: TonB-dependent receptor plug domain-containing protein [Limisphaerales bacterium]
MSSKLYYTFENQWQPSFDGFGAFFAGAINRLNVATHMVDWQNDFQVREDWNIAAGTLWQDQIVDRNEGTAAAINANLQTFGIYAQSQWTPTDAFSLINAVRFDKYSDYDDEFTWRNGIAYNFQSTGTDLFANIARSVAPPTPQDLYFPGGFANPSLLPEESVSYEIGVRQEIIPEQINSSLTLFRHDYDEFIASNAGTGFVPMNVGNTDINGLEAGLSFLPMEFIRLNANYTYLDTKVDNTGRRLIRRPRHQINTSINLKPTAPLTIALGMTYAIGREDGGANTPIGDYALLNGRISYQVQENTTLWIRGENLLDDKFEYTAGFPALRMGLYGGVKIEF